MPISNVLQLAGTFVAVAINVGCGVRLYRMGNRHEAEVRAFGETCAATLRSYEPAVALVTTLRDSPVVPPELRRAAAVALAPTGYVPVSTRVH